MIQVFRTPVVKKRFIRLRGIDAAAFMLPLRRPHLGALDKNSFARLASIDNRLARLATTFRCDAFAVNAREHQYDVAWPGPLGSSGDSTERCFAGSRVPVVAIR